MSFINFLENHQLPCFYKKYLNIDCPGCGMQSAIVELLKGNIIESFKLYPALIPMILMFVFLILHIILKIKNGAIILKYLFIINVIIILTSYFIKIL